ncbi:GtrA family protein [Qipengyuania zhejiangensis]|uniref:GtrA family protein n=1 Tax=Qipengyuania zhejiangensis TaxID=3077782 RepID=UPI002D776571|nr:GtrA family protein [Qipengyuania sp. Z2]
MSVIGLNAHGRLARLRDVRFLRYIVASAIALGIDMGSFLALLALGVGAVPASAAGYAVGILAHWIISSRKVFTDGVAARGAARNRQKMLFIASALIGLATTAAIVGAGEALGLDARIAKLVAIGASFLITWIMRSRIVFRGGAGR